MTSYKKNQIFSFFLTLMNALTIYKFGVKCTIMGTFRLFVGRNFFHTVLMTAFSAKPTNRISSFIAFHDISSKRWSHLQAWENDRLLPCEIPQILYVYFPDVFLILPNSQTHYCIDNTLACVDRPLIIP
jgi:hypothetical protein